MRFKVPKGYGVPPHTLSKAGLFTVISGPSLWGWVRRPIRVKWPPKETLTSPNTCGCLGVFFLAPCSHPVRLISPLQGRKSPPVFGREDQVVISI
jgi:hypothetical protein